MILMKDFAIQPLQALNCRQEKPVDRDWTVLVTTKRVARRRTYALELSGRTSEPEFETEEIHIKWSEETGLSWWPEEVRVNLVDLPNYQSALD